MRRLPIDDPIKTTNDPRTEIHKCERQRQNMANPSSDAKVVHKSSFEECSFQS